MQQDPFVEFVLAARPVVLAAMGRYGKSLSIEDREDVCQEVFISLYRVWKRGKLRKIENPESYIFTVAKHMAIRASTKVVEKTNLESDLESYSYVETASPLSQDEKDALWEAVAKLPDTYREVVVYVLNGYSLVELSLKWQISVNTVKSMVHRAKQHLALALRKEERLCESEQDK